MENVTLVEFEIRSQNKIKRFIELDVLCNQLSLVTLRDMSIIRKIPLITNNSVLEIE